MYAADYIKDPANKPRNEKELEDQILRKAADFNVDFLRKNAKLEEPQEDENQKREKEEARKRHLNMFKESLGKLPPLPDQKEKKQPEPKAFNPNRIKIEPLPDNFNFRKPKVEQ